MSNQSNAFKAGADLHARADETWLDELQALADRFGCGVSADMATMSRAQLWALYGFLKAEARGA